MTMERLQHILSTWKVDDLNTILRLSGGDCEIALHRILKHEGTGLPAAALIRSLGGDRAPGGGHHQQRQRRQRFRHAEGGASDPGMWGSAGCVNRQLPPRDVAAGPSPRATRASPRIERRNEVPNVLSGHQSHTASNCKDFSQFPVIPSAVWVEAEACGRGDQGGHSNSFSNPEGVVLVEAEAYGRMLRGVDSNSCSNSREHSQTLNTGSSSDAADTDLDLLDVPPEVLLQQLTPSEKDQLLHKLLLFHRHPGGQVRRGKAETTKRATKFTTTEVDVLNVQSGLLMSLKEKPRNFHSDNIDDEAMKLGTRMSREEFRDFCRRQDKQREAEKAILEKVKLESCRFQDVNDEEANLIERAERVSLRPLYSMSNEERLVEDVKRESLMCLAERDGFVQGVKTTSAALPISVECTSQALPSVLPVGKLIPSFSTLEFQDGTLSESVPRLPFLPIQEDLVDLSSSMSDRKPPARDLTRVSDASVSSETLREDFGLFDVGFILPSTFMSSYEDESTKSEN